jgi:hypothetical protein
MGRRASVARERRGKRRKGFVPGFPGRAPGVRARQLYVIAIVTAAPSTVAVPFAGLGIFTCEGFATHA